MSELRGLGTVDPRQAVTLTDIRIEPAKDGTAAGWSGLSPDVAVPEWVWTQRNGIPVAGAAARTSDPATRLTGEWVWGGWAVHQPGHFVSEHATRLLFSARERPDSGVLFLLRKGADPAAQPAWFWDILDWFGIARERVAFVAGTPVVVESLTVFPQAEHLTGLQDDAPGRRDLDPTGLPSEDYLTALAENFASKSLTPVEHDVVYVSRAGLPVKIGGEGYLETLLEDAGVTVVRPEGLTIAEQMSVFAGAKKLVFAEGSALHFRQLIGYVPQTVTVLQRRPGRMVARGPLISRCDSLDYVDVVRGLVCGPFHPDTGIPFGHVAFGLADPAKLIGAFADLGVDFRDQWDADAFDAAVRDDLLEWARYVRGLSTKNALRYALNALVTLSALGASPELAEQVARELEPSKGVVHIQDVSQIQDERARLSGQIALLERELASLNRSASLRVGKAVLLPAVQAKRWFDRSAQKRGH